MSTFARVINPDLPNWGERIELFHCVESGRYVPYLYRDTIGRMYRNEDLKHDQSPEMVNLVWDVLENEEAYVGTHWMSPD
jgi:hypothetical protein